MKVQLLGKGLITKLLNIYNNLGLPEATYFKRFWVIYTWNELIKRFAMNYSIELMPIDNIGNDETTRMAIEKLMKTDNFVELNGQFKVPRETWQEMLGKLIDAGIIRQNLSFRATYSFAFLYKFYLRLSGNPATNR